MKKLFFVILLAGLALGLSCKKKAESKPEPVASQPETLPGNPPAQMPEGKIIAPEKFFRFELDKMTLIKDHETSLLQSLKTAKSKESAIARIKEGNKKLVEKAVAMTQKAEITPFDYRKTVTDPIAQKANQEYIMAHAEINEKLMQLQNEIRSIDQAAENELNRLKITKEDLMERPPAAQPGSATPAPPAAK